MLSGTAAYNDDGTETTLHAGDSCICLSDHGHSIACAGEEPLTVYAVINKKQIFAECAEFSARIVFWPCMLE